MRGKLRTYPLILIFLDRFLLLLSSRPLRSLEVVEGFREVCLQSLALELPLPAGQEEDFHQFLLIYFILVIITEPSSLIISRSPSGSTWGQELAQADSCSAPSTASWCPWPAGQYMLD